jgi:toxin ParE1/3/4
MPGIEPTAEIRDDFDCSLAHLIKHEIADAGRRINDIILAIEGLASNPLLGRPVSVDLRELISGRHARGYVALYRYVEQIDSVFVLAIRSQREVGYSTW